MPCGPRYEVSNTNLDEYASFSCFYNSRGRKVSDVMAAKNQQPGMASASRWTRQTGAKRPKEATTAKHQTGTCIRPRYGEQQSSSSTPQTCRTPPPTTTAAPSRQNGPWAALDLLPIRPLLISHLCDPGRVPSKRHFCSAV